MSDFTELVDGLFGIPDPKALTPTQFVDKEAQNVKNAIVRLPAVVQPFLDVEVDTAKNLLDAAIPFAGTAIGDMVTGVAPQAEAAFLGFLARALGGPAAAAVETTVNAAAATPWGQAIIKQSATAWTAMIAHLEARASAGALTAPTVPPPATPNVG